MALTPSNMLPLGTVAPDFNLLDTVTEEYVGLKDLGSSKGTVVMFICNHCPYVIHVQDEIAAIAREYQEKQVSFIAISSNDADNYPADSPELMKERAQELDFNFPYLYDETQEVAKAYKAACTPDFYIFDKDLKCVYRGRMDEATPGNGKPVNGQDLRSALDAVIAGIAVSQDQHPSMGCNIKWK